MFMTAISSVPVIDLRPLLDDPAFDGQPSCDAARAIDEACRSLGFFCVRGHDVPASLATSLESLARQFFALPEDEKARVAMAHGGPAWRGWFPLGGELTSGVP